MVKEADAITELFDGFRLMRDEDDDFTLREMLSSARCTFFEKPRRRRQRLHRSRALGLDEETVRRYVRYLGFALVCIPE